MLTFCFLSLTDIELGYSNGIFSCYLVIIVYSLSLIDLFSAEIAIEAARAALHGGISVVSLNVSRYYIVY